jgi:hypothetical protein
MSQVEPFGGGKARAPRPEKGRKLPEKPYPPSTLQGKSERCILFPNIAQQFDLKRETFKAK